MPRRILWFWIAGALLAAPLLHGQACEEPLRLDVSEVATPAVIVQPASADFALPPPPRPDPLHLRLLRYVAETARHKAAGLASYYSHSLEGTLTANGERYREQRLTAAHLTLPLGCWIEIKARATGKTLRVRVNDRGPYVHKFVLDLSYAAARALGVDVAEDRHVDFRIIAMPGEEPLPADVYMPSGAPLADAQTAAK